MDDAELYSVFNSMQRQTTERVVKEFLPRMHWSTDEIVLDVGCGPGDVTTEVLLPNLPLTASLVTNSSYHYVWVDSKHSFLKIPHI